jgi:hypothetical protein
MMTLITGANGSTAYAAGWGDYTTTDFTTVTGQPARTIADFARDHAAHLTAPGTAPGNQGRPA